MTLETVLIIAVVLLFLAYFSSFTFLAKKYWDLRLELFELDQHIDQLLREKGLK